MDFLVELFRNLLEREDWTMSQACTDSYQKTLKKWHGWLASSTFSLGMKLAPEKKKFMDVICGTGDIKADNEKFCTNFTPLFEENHKFLEKIKDLRVEQSWPVDGSSTPQPVDENQLFYDAVGGRNSRNMIYDLGSSRDIFYTPSRTQLPMSVNLPS